MIVITTLRVISFLTSAMRSLRLAKRLQRGSARILRARFGILPKC
ncbi:MAG: hypothetical protein QOH24_1837 [Verrucomicrobiota bacterium]